MSLTRRMFTAGAGVAMAAPVLADNRLHEIAIRDFAFHPPVLSVSPEDRIRFTNHDLAPHTATAQDGSWDSGELEEGASIILTVTKDWTGGYFCAFHPAMTARLHIEDHK